MLLRGDVGGFGAASELTVNAVLGAGYTASERWSLLLAYRYLRVDFEDTRLVLDLAARGPGIGVQFRF
jgi:opacity protein-like surface antigen